jgi:hypothetical protein
MRRIALVLCLLGATACDENSPTGPTVRLNERFVLAPGETAVVDGSGIGVQFVSVSGDSRCPADVVCIQGGDAIVHVRVIERGSPFDYQLHTGDSSRARVTHGALQLELLELQPYPFSSRTITPGDYRATLAVTRT